MAAKPGIFVVLARCNFDDVICGAYIGAKGLQSAKRRARQVAKNPELRFTNKAQDAVRYGRKLIGRFFAIAGLLKGLWVAE